MNVACDLKRINMPKTISNLWEEITSFENLYKAYKEAAKNKRFYQEVMIFSRDLEENLITIQNELIWDMWQPHEGRAMIIYEPKRRYIYAPQFRDRVVYHALVDVIREYFEKKFIYHSYACRKGKGNHNAVQYVQSKMHGVETEHPGSYALKCDIRSYFASIDHEILKGLFRKTIKDSKVLNLMDIIIDKNEFDYVGLPLGALTSQLFANVYLNELDHYIKEELCVRYYARYMDDFIVIHHDKALLSSLKDDIEQFVTDRLRLQMNPKTAIFPLNKGIDFCGYRIFTDHILPRKRNMKRARRRLKKLCRMYSDGQVSLEDFKSCLMSFLGYVKHCGSKNTVEKILDELILK